MELIQSKSRKVWRSLGKSRKVSFAKVIHDFGTLLDFPRLSGLL